ncbi:mitochondrial carrier [Russula earlei]|uniref:Mitochondrial carrier n=1 Tax=Russula earlei TaxID=71964 RepID=A0ACC0UKD7_9AGAM|nr:mitochondrial carrier [Russula earlei]
MPESSTELSKRAVYDGSISGAHDRPYLPHLRSDPPSYHPLPRSLAEFRAQEGREYRKARLRALWKQLLAALDSDAERSDPDVASYPAVGSSGSSNSISSAALTPESARQMRKMYERELMGSCKSSGHIRWKEFRKYAEEKEAELWDIFHNELDLDSNGRLDAEELTVALRKAGVQVSPSILSDFMTSLTASSHSHPISFQEFRDFLLLLPRRVSTKEIYQFYQVRKFLGDDGRGAARVTMEGDVSLSAEDKPPHYLIYRPPPVQLPPVPSGDHDPTLSDAESDDDGGGLWLGGTTGPQVFSGRRLSRTSTAPFDRLKVFLITRPPDLGGPSPLPGASVRGVKAIASAIARIYAEGGIAAFWVGNGLSVVKIFPESAIKFMTYEASKRFFAYYIDNVEDVRDISGASRFLSGGIGGITSQLSIYPIETLKTQRMSSTEGSNRTLASAARRLWALGGFKAYYRGLGVGLVGVFPYSAIDMSTFEALKLAYLRSTGKDEPGVLAVLAFGSISGSVGASMVYPLNLVRTRLQASGSSGHPERYSGIADVVRKTYGRDGWRGFYRGLVPTLAKVIPSVSISYMVYEQSKRKLGV